VPAPRQDALDRLSRIFAGGKEPAIARHLLDFLAANDKTTHITLQLVRQLTPGAAGGKLDAAIFRTLQFLAGDAVRFLDTRFELLDNEQRPHDLSDEQAREAMLHHVDPLTGDQDPEIESRLLIYFSPNHEVAPAWLVGDPNVNKLGRSARG
jgi:hypothetical protein